jgi:hypothetical protein
MAQYATKRLTSKGNAPLVCSESERSQRKPGLQGKGPAVDLITLSQGEGSVDLDSKLTQQLIEFEKSLSGPSAEPEKILRHFSIMDFNSEKDIVQGSSKDLEATTTPALYSSIHFSPSAG